MILGEWLHAQAHTPQSAPMLRHFAEDSYDCRQACYV